MSNISSGASHTFNISQLKIHCLALYLIFNRVIWITEVYLLEFFVYIRYYPSIGYRIGKNHFPICWLPFCPIDSALCLTDTLPFFFDIPFGVLFRKWTSGPMCLKLFPTFSTFFFNVQNYYFLIRYFLHLHFQCYPKSPPYPLLPYQPTPTSWPWHSPVLRQIKFARLMGLSFQWWPTRPSSNTYAARELSSRGIG